MEQMLFQSLPLYYPDEEILKALHLPEETDTEDLAEANALIRSAKAIANPKALFRVSKILEHGSDFVSIDGIRVDCTLMAHNFRETDQVCPYVCTCGLELEEWSRTLDDPLLAYWADAIKLYYVGAIQRHLFQYVKEHYLRSGHLSHMNPGSLSQWPISQQTVLFSILGDVAGTLGVTLSESYLMIPSKSTSGILFSSNSHYENCSHCPMPDCPGRRAPFSGLTE